MEEKHTPKLNKGSFVCPHCGAYSVMDWHYVVRNPGCFPLEEIAISECKNCDQLAVWLGGRMIYPESLQIQPNEDMPTKAKEFFNEAQSIIGRSPRAATALLRLALEEIVNELEGTGKNLNEKIKSLSLPQDLLTLFEACRLYGNQAAHPGVIDFNEEDSSDIAYNLSNFINIIVALKISPYIQAKVLIKELQNKKANHSK